MTQEPRGVSQDRTGTPLGREPLEPGEPLAILVVGEDLVCTHPVRAGDEIRIGRGPSCELRIDDPSISRTHAVLAIGEELTVRDLGSSNGTFVRGARLGAGETVRASLNEAIGVGAVSLLVRRPARSAAARRTEELIVRDPAVSDMYRLVARIAAGTISVLILGETGVGKGIVAERLHQLSPRCERPLLRLNCAAFAETLLESELFGHEKGAFTGATSEKLGLLEAASGGSVLLDEVGELPLSIQVKLLVALEAKEILRVGGLEPRPVDVRFIAATNRDLEAEVAAGRFREDLYYRLNGATVVVPPLRERRREIEAFAARFAAETAAELGAAPPPDLRPDALGAILDYRWPGNVRELRNVIVRAVLLAGPGPITTAHLPMDKLRAATPSAVPPASAARAAPAVNAADRQRVLDALATCAGNQTRAARLLGISRGTLINRLEAYGIARPRRAK